MKKFIIIFGSTKKFIVNTLCAVAVLFASSIPHATSLPTEKTDVDVPCPGGRWAEVYTNNAWALECSSTYQTIPLPD